MTTSQYAVVGVLLVVGGGPLQRSMMLLGLLLLIAIDTFMQIGCKLAGNNTPPARFAPWLEL